MRITILPAISGRFSRVAPTGSVVRRSGAFYRTDADASCKRDEGRQAGWHAAVDLFKSGGGGGGGDGRSERRLRRVAARSVNNNFNGKHLQGSTSLAEEGKTPQSPTA